MVTQPCGCSLQEESMHQEWIDSEVIVDFKMTLLEHPKWRSKPNFWKTPPKYDDEMYEQHPVNHWSDTKRKKLAYTDHDYIHDDYPVDKERDIIFRNNELIFSPIPSGWAINAEMMPEKDVGLLAGRVFAFVLRTRTFAPLWLWALSPIKTQKESLNNLQLRDNGFKDAIQRLVNAHFRQSSLNTDLQYDVVQGKGKGLIVLLHGAPGVGKTSTAESVAAACGRPLFNITCGDLGLTPVEVEKALKEIFRFAQLWDCVLLLDECDIFLAQRTKNDIVRNGLVSMFLRTLEFYTGVLFLTTNQVGVLDEAIKSRLTYTAYYPPLDEKQTQNIWKVNLRLLKERNKELDVDEKAILRFAKRHFRANIETSSTWNGRQIQNAFKVATALADWDDQSTNDQQHDGGERRRPKLLPSHFEIIAHGAHAFDRYLRAAVGYNDAQRAYNEQVRDDEHQFEAHLSLDTHDHSHRSPAEHYCRSAPSLSPMQTYGRPPSNTIPSSPSIQVPVNMHYTLTYTTQSVVANPQYTGKPKQAILHNPQTHKLVTAGSRATPILFRTCRHPHLMSVRTPCRPHERGGLSENYTKDADRNGVLDPDSDVDSLESDIDVPRDKHPNGSIPESVRYAQREQDEEWD